MNARKYDLVTSQYVIDEASEGDPRLAAERLESLDGIPLLLPDDEVASIANAIVGSAILPVRAAYDALHIAIAARHQIDFLLTWNCKHIANARILPRLHSMFARSILQHQSSALHKS